MRMLYIPLFLAILLAAAMNVGAGDKSPGVLKLPIKKAIYGIAFSNKMDMVAVKDEDYRVHVFEFPSLTFIGDFDNRCPNSQMSFSPCGQFLLIDGEVKERFTLQIWDLKKKPLRLEKVLQLKPDQAKEFRVFPAFEDYRFIKNGGRVIAFDLEPRLHIWDWKTKWHAEQIPLRLHTMIVEGICIPDDRVAVLTAKKEIEIHKVVGMDLEFLQRIDVEPSPGGRFPRPSVFTSDGKTFATLNGRDETIEVHDITKPRSQRVDRVMHFRRLPDGLKGIGIPYLGITMDRSIVIVSFREHNESAVAFFPRTPERAAEFGVEAGKDNFLLMELRHPCGPEAPDIHLSPDGRWLALTRCKTSDPWIWPVEGLGKVLLKQKAAVKKQR